MSASLDVPTQPNTAAATPPPIIVPAADVFTRRAKRFDQLSIGHSLGDWLRYLGTLARAQHDALQAVPSLQLPDTAALARAREHNMPPLHAQSLPRDPAWRDILRQIAAALAPAAPEAGRAQLARLAALSISHTEALAERVLHAELYGEDAGFLPYVAAALQVMWTHLAQRINASIMALDVPGVCPCCGFLPVASIVKGNGQTANLRYLHCALCNTEWYHVRVKCATCASTERIALRELEGEAVTNPGAVRAESCDACNSYLKIIYEEKGGVDPVADDLATLALDILVDDAGYSRAGPNLLLVPGDT